MEQLRQQAASGPEWIESDDAFPCDVGTTFELARRLAGCVQAAVTGAYLPVVLAGNCFSAVGTLAGLGGDDVGVVWLDCHGDFNTPDTTRSGFLDGMALATVTGQCWTEIAATVPGFRPVPGRRVVHLGGRDFDPDERARLEAADVVVLDAAGIRRHGPTAAVRSAISHLSRAAPNVYLHVDLDVLDPDEAPVNSYQKPGGLSVAQVEQIVRLLGSQLPIRAAALTAYDPAIDTTGRAARCGLRLLHCLAEVARHGESASNYLTG
jgi:arginase